MRQGQSDLDGPGELRDASDQAPLASKRGNEVQLPLAPGANKSTPVPSLVRAVAQAKTWYDWIIKGEFGTMRELAKRTASTRTMYYAFSTWLCFRQR